MKIVVLGSGSKGNSTYVETPHAKILFDAGISMLQIRNRLKNEGIMLSSLDAVFVTHEHSDHISNLVSILVKTKATLYIEEHTFIYANKKLKGGLTCLPHKFIKKDTKYEVNDISVVPIELSHDTEYCMGFLAKELNTRRNQTFATITDTGYVPKKYFKVLSYINTILLESNHDVEMLMQSNRPWLLINRILSNNGHLSNKQCADCLKEFVSKNNKTIILGHISEECNDYNLAYDNIVKAFDNKLPFDLKVAYQYEEVPLINLEGDEVA